jgi:hypothetical protein
VKTKTISNTVGWEKAMAPFASDVTRIRIFLELPSVLLTIPKWPRLFAKGERVRGMARSAREASYRDYYTSATYYLSIAALSEFNPIEPACLVV